MEAEPEQSADASADDQLQRMADAVDVGEAVSALEIAAPLFGPDAGLSVAQASRLCALTAQAAQAAGLIELAAQLWTQATLHPSDREAAVQAWVGVGNLHASMHRPDAAEAAWRRALAIDPAHAIALSNLGVLLGGDPARCQEAESLQRTATHLDPDNPVAHTNLGVLLAASHRREEAERHYRRALDIDPRHAPAHANLALLLEENQRLDEAEMHQRAAIALAPHSAEIHANLGNLLAARTRAAEAESLLRRALELDPASAAIHNSLAVLLADQRRDQEAEQRFRHALALRPGYALARLNLSRLLLAQGRFSEGWSLHEARHDPSLPDNGIAPPPIDLPAWRGEALAGKSVLFWPEQGLGDQIQFVRYVSRLKALGAARVTLVCQRELAVLFQTVPGADAVVPADIVDNAYTVDQATLQHHDLWTFPLSVPTWSGSDLADVAPPYLRAQPQRVDGWSRRLANAGRRVALVWRGNPRHDNDPDRSLPGLQTLAPLWQVPGLSFISLQSGSRGAEAQDPPSSQPLQHLGGELRDFADTAAALAACDLLICVDTSIAHLAGAMGVPCWILLPAHRTDWRWLRERSDSPWYPGTTRLFRQAHRGDWGMTVSQVAQALEGWAANPESNEND